MSSVVCWKTVDRELINQHFLFNIKVYNNEITYDTTYELLYDTTNTVPGGAIYHDYPLALNIDLRNTTTNTLKYKVLSMNI